MAADSPALEAIWRDLRPHLEWAEGFALALLFAGHPQPVGFLRQRLDESLQLRTLRLTVIAPATTDEVARAVAQILAARPEPGRGPLWVEMWRGGDEEGWPPARRQALHRLNERRFLLEHDVALPIVLVLPREERGRVYVEAPDLWAVRAFTAELPPPQPGTAGVRFDLRTPNGSSSSPSIAEREWARLLERAVDQSELDPRDAAAAFEKALERGDLPGAESIARQSVELADRRLGADGETPRTLRGVLLALSNLGRVERDLGRFQAARAAYHETMRRARNLHSKMGDSPEALRELSTALDNVGRIESDVGNLQAARAAFKESLDLRRRVRDLAGETPQALRDLSIALGNIGQVERDLGAAERARIAWREALDTAREAVKSSGGPLPALRDVAVALLNIGRIEHDLGNLAAARSAYREALEIARHLRIGLGDTPRTLCDLAVALVASAETERDLGNGSVTQALGRESQEIIRQLHLLSAGQPQFEHDLSALEARAKTLQRFLEDRP